MIFAKKNKVSEENNAKRETKHKVVFGGPPSALTEIVFRHSCQKFGVGVDVEQVGANAIPKAVVTWSSAPKELVGAYALVGTPSHNAILELLISGSSSIVIVLNPNLRYWEENKNFLKMLYFSAQKNHLNLDKMPVIFQYHAETAEDWERSPEELDAFLDNSPNYYPRLVSGPSVDEVHLGFELAIRLIVEG